MKEYVARHALFAQSSYCKSTILKTICKRFQSSEREFVLRFSQWWHGLEPRLSWRLSVRQGVHDGQENEGYVETFLQQMQISKGEYELFLKVLI